MDLKSKIRVTIPREYSGSDIYNRYEYQIFFAAGLIIDLSSREEEFVTFLDHLDDVVVVSGEDDEKMITFYQVKSKSNGNITLYNVIKEKWISKLKYNLDSFSEFSSKGILVTNTGISNRSRLFNELEIIEFEKLLDANSETNNELFYKNICEEFAIEKDELNLNRIFILRSELTLDSYESQIKAKLVEYCKSINDKLTIASLSTINDQLKIMLSRKQKSKYAPTEEYDKLIEKKGFTKRLLDDIIIKTWAIEFPNFFELYNFSTDFMKYTFKDNLDKLKLMTKYNAFTQHKIESGTQTFVEIYKEINKIKEDVTFDKDNIVEDIINYLEKKSQYTDSIFYKSYVEFIVLINLFKEGN